MNTIHLNIIVVKKYFVALGFWSLDVNVKRNALTQNNVIFCPMRLYDEPLHNVYSYVTEKMKIRRPLSRYLSCVDLFLIYVDISPVGGNQATVLTSNIT